jgi:hypothetical protein
LLPRDLSHAESDGWEYHGDARGPKGKLEDGLWEMRVDAGNDTITGKREVRRRHWKSGSRVPPSAGINLCRFGTRGPTWLRPLVVMD